MATFDLSLFYSLTLNYLYERAAKHTVVPIPRGASEEQIHDLQHLTPGDLEIYYSPTKTENIKGDDGVYNIRRLFLRLCFHRQNGAYVRGVINYDKNYEIIRDFTLDFDPIKFLNCYPTAEAATEKLKKVLKLSSGRTKQVGQYAESVYSFAVFLSRFNDYESFINKALSFDVFAPLYISINTKGMKTLAFDFLKELDSRFDICKPDNHIKIIAKALGIINVGHDSYDDLRTSMAIGDLAKRISESIDQKVSAYKLDKILWLICSETFYYHDNIRNSSDDKREEYLAYILPKLGINKA